MWRLWRYGSLPVERWGYDYCIARGPNAFVQEGSELDERLPSKSVIQVRELGKKSAFLIRQSRPTSSSRDAASNEIHSA